MQMHNQAFSYLSVNKRKGSDCRLFNKTDHPHWSQIEWVNYFTFLQPQKR